MRPLVMQVAAAQRKIGTEGALRSACSAGGFGPPVAQSKSSTVCTIGSDVPEPICIMQPMLPAAMRSGDLASSVRTLRAFNWAEISGCSRL